MRSVYWVVLLLVRLVVVVVMVVGLGTGHSTGRCCCWWPWSEHSRHEHSRRAMVSVVAINRMFQFKWQHDYKVVVSIIYRMDGAILLFINDSHCLTTL